jgi:hypothetical protein
MYTLYIEYMPKMILQQVFSLQQNGSILHVPLGGIIYQYLTDLQINTNITYYHHNMQLQ